MELVFTKDELLRSIQILQGVTAGRNTLPILSNVLVRAADNRIEMSGHRPRGRHQDRCPRHNLQRGRHYRFREETR